MLYLNQDLNTDKIGRKFTMESKRTVEVIIGGKTYRLAGVESEEYIQSLARYIDGKLKDLDSKSATSIAYKEAFPIIFALNIADDLFKERENRGVVVTNDTDKTKEQEQEILKYKELTNKLNKEIDELKKNENSWENIAKQLKDTTAKNNALKKELEEKEEEIQELNKKCAEKTLEINELNKKNIDKNKELNNLSRKLSEKNTILNELNEKSALRNKKLNTVNKERDELALKLKKNDM